MEQKCEQTRSGNSMRGCVDTKAITRVGTEMHRVRWTIEAVSKLALDKILTSPDFHLNPSCMANISLERNDPELYVYICNKSDSEIQIERKISLLDSNSRKLHEENDDEIFTIGKDEDVDILGDINDKIVCDALPNDRLIIDLCISLRGEITTKVSRSLYVTDSKKKLMEDLRTMLETSVNSDVSLQIGDDRIPAHWSVLCSRSPYFKRMFDSEKLDRNQNTVAITDFSLFALKKIVQFLYTADFNESNEEDIEELFDLYYAADKCEMMDMRILCSAKIMSKATADNVCQILQLALRHSDEDLKSQATAFIKLHSDAFFQTNAWKNLLNQTDPRAVV